jgi:hypothetical protein
MTIKPIKQKTFNEPQETYLSVYPEEWEYIKQEMEEQVDENEN